MAQYVVDGDKLTAIADAIRAKTGGTENLTLDQMPTEIAGIETEAEISLQNKEISENGTYSADDGYDGLGQVTVNVASSGGGSDEEIINNMLTRGFTEFSSDATSIGHYVFCECRSLTDINFPNLTSIGNYAFSYCTALTDVDFPNVTSIGFQSFFQCWDLENVSLPNIATIPTQSFGGCSALTTIDFSSAISIGSYAFNGCNALITADFPLATSIAANAFGSCRKLTALILRSETMCTIANTNAFNYCYRILGTYHSTYNPDSAKDGYIYVPRALVDTYKADSVWSTFATQFRALEDYTVDGTTTGALDESKI